MKRTERCSFKADIGQMNGLYAFVSGTLRDYGVPEKYLPSVEMAADEIFSNIAKYAYSDGPARNSDDAVVVTLDIRDGEIALTFEDSAGPFDPLSAAPPRLDDGAEREPGGLGIYLARSVMDGASYSRNGGRNVLTLVKFFDCV